MEIFSSAFGIVFTCVQEISGLEKGIEYEFRVAGVNNVGPGQETIKFYLTPEGLYHVLSTKSK